MTDDPSTEFEEKEATSTKDTLRFSPALREGLELNLIHDLEVQLQCERSGQCSLLPYQEGGGVEMGWILIRKF